MSSNRIITIFGVTGTQGSAVLDVILKDKTFTPRGVTRDPTSQAAQELKKRGVEIVRGDFADKDSLLNAVKGSEVVFTTTHPVYLTGNPDAPAEIDQGKAVVDAAKQAGVKFFVWSSLPSVDKISGGEFKIPHCDEKAEVDEYLRSSGLPHVIFYTAYFLEDCWNAVKLLRPNPEGGFNLVVPGIPPTLKMIFTWVEKDLGASVLTALKNYESRPNDILGKGFYVNTEEITMPDFAEALSKSLGKPVKFVSPEAVGYKPLDDMFAFTVKYWRPSEYGIPDRRLVDLGVKFGTIKEFIEVKREKLLSV